jgi:histidine ammonia-lyase
MRYRQPLDFENGDKVISEVISWSAHSSGMDLLKISHGGIGQHSGKRIERLVNPQLNDLPPFLSLSRIAIRGYDMQYCAASRYQK